jgi:hypothetical protein
VAARDEATGSARDERSTHAALLASLDSQAAQHAIESRMPLPPSLAGSILERVTVRHTLPSSASWRTHYVLKRLAPEHGWLGAATHDVRIREVQLARSDLLGALPHLLATPLRTLSIEGDPTDPVAAGLIMDDVTCALVRQPIGGAGARLTGELLLLLDRLARLHAHFWDDPRLQDATLGLVTPHDALLLAAPATLAERIASGDDNPYLPLAQRGWEAFFALADPRDAAALQCLLDDPEPVVRRIDALPRTLVHGDVWAPNVGWLPAGAHRRASSAPSHPRRSAPDLIPRLPRRKGEGEAHRAAGESHACRAGSRLLLLDWALTAAAPATYDPLWLCGATHTLNPVAVLAAYRARLERHLRSRGISLAPVVWRALAHAAYLRTALTCGEALGRAAAEAPSGSARRRAEARARWWARRATLAMHALLSP